MAKIEGDLSLMSIADLMQWIDMSKKTGTLLIELNNVTKRFYFQEGKIIYVSSQQKGEMLGEYLLSKNVLTIAQLKDAIQKSQALEVPFTGYIISEGIVTAELLEAIIREIAEKAFIDSLNWKEGTFQFKDSLPPSVVNGPVKINTSYVVLQSFKTFDTQQNTSEADRQEILKELAHKISSGKLELPPVPDIIVKLNNAIKDENTTIVDISKMIMSDQILTSKILKIVNSSYYAKYGKITSLQQAIIHMGLKSLISIVTVYTLGGSNTRNAERVKEVLKHSLITAFIARYLSSFVSVDPEEAFVCGLLHDIGKTVILEHIHNHSLTDEELTDFLKRYHSEVGFLLSVKWKFPEVVRETIRLHHRLEEAEKFRETIALIDTSNRIANSLDEPERIKEMLNGYAERGVSLDEFNEELDEFVKEASIFV